MLLADIINKFNNVNNDDDIKEWITVKGNHIPIKEGETKKEAVEKFINKTSDKKEKLDNIPVGSSGYSLKLVKSHNISLNMRKAMEKGFYPEDMIKLEVSGSTKDGKRLKQLFEENKKYKTNFKVTYLYKDDKTNEDYLFYKGVDKFTNYFDTKEQAEKWIKENKHKIKDVSEPKEVKEWHHIRTSGSDILIDINHLKDLGFKIDTRTANKEFKLNSVDNSVQVVTNSLIQLGDDIETETNGKGRKFVSRFIEAGIAHYNELGNILITKETLDKFLNTMVGCPVVILHKDITDENADKERVGVISDVWYNDKDGWFYCSGVIWDKKAIDLIKNHNWNVSCTYEYVSDFTPRDYNGGKIDMEFTDGKFLYLAIVDNPRYTGANIVINSNVNNWNEIEHPRDEQGKFTEKGGNVKSFYEKEYKEALKEISEGKDYAQINFNTTIQQMKSALEHLKKQDSDWDKYDVDENIKEYDDLSDDWNKEQIKRIAREKAAQDTLKKWIREGKDRKNEYYKIYEPHKYKKQEEKQVNNSNRKDNLIMAVMDELKQFIVNIVNNECDKKVKNEDVDKRELLREADAIAMKPASEFKGGEEEKFRTLTKKLEELGYNKSLAGTSDNEDEEKEEDKKAENSKKCKNEDDEEDKEEYKKAKEIADNKKVNNSLSDETVKHIADMIMGGKKTDENVSLYTSQEERLKLGDNY